MRGDIERMTIAAQLADRIEREIHADTWQGELPGKRTFVEPSVERWIHTLKVVGSRETILCSGLIEVDFGTELFNLREDLGETGNLAEYSPAKTRELAELLRRRLRRCIR